MIEPVSGQLLIERDKPPERKGGYVLGNTNKYLRLNSGIVKKGDKYVGTKVYFQDFSGVDIDENLIVIPVEDIVAVDVKKE